MTPGTKAPGLCFWQIPVTCCPKAEGPCWNLPPCPPREQSSLDWRQLLSFLKVFAGKPETHVFRPKSPREASAPAAERRGPRVSCTGNTEGVQGPWCGWKSHRSWLPGRVEKPKAEFGQTHCFYFRPKAREPEVRAVSSSGRVEKIKGKVRVHTPTCRGEGAGVAPEALAQREGSLHASSERSLQTFALFTRSQGPVSQAQLGPRGACQKGRWLPPTPALQTGQPWD